MPLKNQFPTGISSGYDKTPNQNEPQPFTKLSFAGDCTFDFLDKESYQRLTTTLTGIVYNTSIKPDTGMLLFAWGFDSILSYFEIETRKSNKLL